ncbi:glycosyltransferase family 1 protein [Streptomyces rectiverticillatus]|uniref:glycosyltransferase n=1 Tax=Streptomyces rectiverticillatus TaxID=173860 RepID=UPI0015C2F8F7|nr:glycosyltransferase [Streptomyces rectiverticillatus]QLE73099.1 glycosyltransferase family 1 protein [Streptomyces rectiverticillatus]
MHVLFVTSGSTGDVAPFTGLGVRLQQAGHAVTVATHERFAGLIRACGLGFRRLPLDPREMHEACAQRLSGRTDGPLGTLMVAKQGTAYTADLAHGILQAVRQGADVVVASGQTALLAKAVADCLGMPSTGALLQPVAPTGAFAPMALGRRSAGRIGNRLISGALWRAFHHQAASTARWVRAELGLPPLSRTARRRPAGNWPIWYGFSPHVVPRPGDWSPEHRVAGYWWPEETSVWQPDPRLADFLAAGPPPVFIGFGSTPSPDSEQLSAVCTEALRRAGVRGVVQAGWSGLAAESDDILTVGEVSHRWLFPRTAAVVHHAGGGTTAAGLRAGVPAVPVPAFYDQPFWSARLRSLGVAPGVLPMADLTADGLAALITRAVREPAWRSRAAELRTALAAEDGTAPVVEAVEALAAR